MLTDSVNMEHMKNANESFMKYIMKILDWVEADFVRVLYFNE